MSHARAHAAAMDLYNRLHWRPFATIPLDPDGPPLLLKIETFRTRAIVLVVAQWDENFLQFRIFTGDVWIALGGTIFEWMPLPPEWATAPRPMPDPA